MPKVENGNASCTPANGIASSSFYGRVNAVSEAPATYHMNLQRLRKAGIGSWGYDCNLCPLRQSASQVVWGAGNFNAKIMLIGEGPGFNEDRLGQPFVGRAGKLLDTILFNSALRRDELFITNRVRCRPPENRRPTPIEMETCDAWTEKEIETVGPKVIISLGNSAIQRAFPGRKIGEVSGLARSTSLGKEQTPTVQIATYHPAAALRNPDLTKEIIEAMQTAKEIANAVG